MDVTRFVEALEQDLAQIAAVGDETTAAAAERLLVALRTAAGVRLLDALTEAVLELSGQLPGGHVEVRLVGREPSLVYVAEEEEEPTPTGADDGLAARVTLRLPEALKAAVEQAAASESLSVNSWLVRAIARAVNAPPTRGPGNRLRGFAQS